MSKKNPLDAIRKKNNLWLKTTFGLLALLMGVFQIWLFHDGLASIDALSYMEIGEALLQGEWAKGITGYWNPLYPYLLGLALAIVKPSPHWEFFTVKLVNFAIYIFTFFCFQFLLYEVIHFYHQNIAKKPSEGYLKIPEWLCLLFGYTLFLLATVCWIPLYCDTPDLLVSALIYLASGILLRLHTRSASWFDPVALGATLGLAYLAKTVMFPISLVLIAVSIFAGNNRKVAVRRSLISLLVLAIVTTPFISVLSISKGRLTLGDSGKISYAWSMGLYKFYKDQLDVRLFDVDPRIGIIGIPKHPSRKIFNQPRVVEYTVPASSTLPGWYDPSYWWEGVSFKFNLQGQLLVLVKNSIFLYKSILGILVFGYLILIFQVESFRPSIRALRENWILLVPAVVGLGIYWMGAGDLKRYNFFEQPSTRYLAAFFVLLVAGVVSSVRLPTTQLSKRLVVWMTILFLVGSSFALLSHLATDFNTSKGRSSFVHSQLDVVENLESLGIRAGDRVAIIGHTGSYFQWARLAKVKIVTLVGQEFEGVDPEMRQAALKAIGESGCKAVFQYSPPSALGFTKDTAFQYSPNALGFMREAGWKRIGNTDYYTYVFAI